MFTAQHEKEKRPSKPINPKNAAQSSEEDQNEEEEEYVPRKQLSNSQKSEDGSEEETLSNLKSQIQDKFSKQNYREILKNQTALGQGIQIPTKFTVSETQKQIKSATLQSSNSDPRKICICDVPPELDHIELRKKLISFGKVVNLCLVDKNGIDYGESSIKNSLKNEAELCYKLFFLSGSQSRTGIVEYKSPEEANRAMFQKIIKIRKDSSMMMRFMTIPERMSYFLNFQIPEDHPGVSTTSQNIGEMTAKRNTATE